VAVEDRQDTQVLGSARRLLRPDHVAKIRDDNFYVIDPQEGRVGGKHASLNTAMGRDIVVIGRELAVRILHRV
jgi:hypothetical protein